MSIGRIFFILRHIQNRDGFNSMPKISQLLKLTRHSTVFPNRKLLKTGGGQRPKEFLWAVKANRYITHIKRLRDTGEALEKFFSAARALKEKLGPVLFQLPPGLAFHEDTLD